jgi:mannosyltransferase OCH1-like enzyme
MNVFQIFISDSPAPLPPYLQQCIDSVKMAFPQHPYRLFDGEALRAFIAEQYGAEVVNAYDMLQPYAYKSDLGRYCLLQHFGGWYADVSVRMAGVMNLNPNTRSVAFRDVLQSSWTPYACSNALLYAHAGDPVFQRAIDMVVENCRSRHYGVSTLCPTGPNLLGRAFAIEGPDRTRMFGELVLLTPAHEVKNHTFVARDGQIIAFKKPHGSTLEMLGTQGTNNYSAIYAAGQVYGPA